MAGRLGNDFDANEPADDSSLRYGASWIRDTKSRLVSFVSVLFNRETGDFRDNVIRTASLRDLSPSPAGTWREVEVNAKGLVISGTNPDEQPTASFYRAVFKDGGASGSMKYETASGIVSSTVAGPAVIYSGSGTFIGTYEAGSSHWPFTFVVPEGVHRIKYRLSGAGGGSWAGSPIGIDVNSTNDRTADAVTGFRFNSGTHAFLPDDTFLQNERTGEQIKITNSVFDGTPDWVYTVLRAQNGTTADNVVDGDDWISIRFGGAGGEYVEGVMPVTPGTNLSIIVGIGGEEGAGGVEAKAGGNSRVSSGALYVEAAGGKQGGLTEAGEPATGSKQSTLLNVVVPGTEGSTLEGGIGGAPIGSSPTSAGTIYGNGGAADDPEDGTSGIVILEWVK